MINTVVIGGGTGSATMLRGLKNIESLHLTSIVTVADSGGSTGRIRSLYDMPALGDIRNVMIALAESESTLTYLMDYRFKDIATKDGDRDVGGHNLGNLILAALVQGSGNINTAIGEISKVLRVKGQIIPSTTQSITLYARMDDGTIVMGEDNIPKVHNSIDKVYYNEAASATPSAVKAILEADVIVLGIGSLYTSILPNIIIEGISDAIKESKGKIVYYCNAMTQSGETDHYSCEDHVAAIERHGDFKCDAVVFASDDIPEGALTNYRQEQSVPVRIVKDRHDYPIYEHMMLDFSNHQVRHDPQLVANSFIQLLEKLGIKDD